MSLQADLWIASLLLFVLFVSLGISVSNKPLGALDARAIVFRGQATRLAVVFAKSGRSKGVTLLCAISLATYALMRLPVWIPLVMILSQILSQTIVEIVKLRYRRLRPDYWLAGLEAGHSYPSGHAVTAIVFFAGWAFVAASSAAPPVLKEAAVAALALWAAGISWSRLALGAHYLSDVAGGTLFGAAWLCALLGASHALVRVP